MWFENKIDWIFVQTLKKKILCQFQNHMLSIVFISILSCVPRQNMMCTREYRPVCGNGTTFSNRCMAETVGFYNDCAKFLTAGECGDAMTARLRCDDGDFPSEKGMCVRKPWSDFSTCEEEKRQGACPGGADPNPWVGEHCQITCGNFQRTQISDDGP